MVVLRPPRFVGRGDYVIIVAIGNYAPVPSDTDYDGSAWPAVNSQRLSIGSSCLRFDTNIDATLYQARIVGAVDGATDAGWFNLTNATRSLAGITLVSLSAPPMAPTRPLPFTSIHDRLALDSWHCEYRRFQFAGNQCDVGNTSGYFDDLSFQDNVTVQRFPRTTNVTVLAVGSATFNVGCAAGSPTPLFYWQKNGAPLTNGGNISGANSPRLLSAVARLVTGRLFLPGQQSGGVAVGMATLTVIFRRRLIAGPSWRHVLRERRWHSNFWLRHTRPTPSITREQRQ